MEPIYGSLEKEIEVLSAILPDEKVIYVVLVGKRTTSFSRDIHSSKN
jgi:hypothetical protein